jgi:Flp pilus assembly protein TadD
VEAARSTDSSSDENRPDGPPPRSSGSANGRIRLLFILVALATAAVFANALDGGFVWVDHKEIVQEAFVIDSLDDLRTAWTGPVTDMGRQSESRSSGYYRPVQLLFVTLNTWLFGKNAALHHIPNILLHIASTLLLMWLILRLTGDRFAAGLCGFLFGVHPVHVESVTWISGNKDTLSGFFFFAALALYVKWSGTRTTPGGRNAWTLIVGVALFALGLLSKESVIVLPAVIVLMELILGSSGAAGAEEAPRPGFAARWSGAAAFALAAAAYLVLRRALLGAMGDMEGWHGEGPLQTFLTMPGVLAEYVGKLFAPLGLTTADTTRIVTSFGDPVFLAGAFVVVALVAAAFIGRRSHPAAAFGIAWFFVALLPVMNILPIHHIKAERFLYLPSAGFFLAVAAVWSRLAGGRGEADTETRFTVRKNNALAAAAVYVLLLGIATVDRNGDWKNDLTLFETDTDRTPNYREGHAMLGFAHVLHGQNTAALDHLDAAAREDPRYASFVNRLGLFDGTGRALMGLGRAEEALVAFGRAAVLAPNEPLVYMNMAIALGALGRVDEALESYGRAERLDPDSLLLHFNRGLTLFRAARLDEALRDLERAAELDPGHVGTLNLKGSIHFERGEREAAAICFRRSLRIRPQQPMIEELLRRAEGEVPDP